MHYDGVFQVTEKWKCIGVFTFFMCNKFCTYLQINLTLIPMPMLGLTMRNTKFGVRKNPQHCFAERFLIVMFKYEKNETYTMEVCMGSWGFSSSYPLCLGSASGPTLACCWLRGFKMSISKVFNVIKILEDLKEFSVCVIFNIYCIGNENWRNGKVP